MNSVHQSEGELEQTIVQPSLGPVDGKERFMSMDVIRGVALFGILIMNMLGFGYGTGAVEYIDPATRTGADFWSWVVMNTYFEGTQRALFSLLFGAGVVIMTSRAEKAHGGILIADIYYRRNIWLIVFGLVNSYLLLWDGDILYYYGISALFLFPLRNLSPRHLLMAGVAGLIALSLVYRYDMNEEYVAFAEYTEAQELLSAGESLTDDHQDAVDTWEEKIADHDPDAEKRQENIGFHTGSYWKTFMHHLPLLTTYHGNDTFRYMFLDGFSLMVIGMALFKLGFLTLLRSNGTYWLMVLVGYGIGLPVSWWETSHMIGNNFTLLALADTWPSYDVGRSFNAAGHLGLLLLFVRSGWLGWLQRSLAAVGRMALSNYLAHSIINAFVFLGIGLGLYGSMSRIEVYYVGLGIVLFQLLISPVWLRYFRFGPAEWLWRSLTYMKKQKFRR